MKRGDIWWHEPPDVKRRPVLILARDETIQRLHDVIAVPATGVIRGRSNEVPVGAEDGMPMNCVLVAENALSADKTFLTRRITTLAPRKIDAICRALARATSCG